VELEAGAVPVVVAKALVVVEVAMVELGAEAVALSSLRPAILRMAVRFVRTGAMGVTDYPVTNCFWTAPRVAEAQAVVAGADSSTSFPITALMGRSR
jgi:hypothetical protein